MSELSNKAVVEKEQELRPVRFTETGRMRLGKILKAARQTTGWSVSKTEFKTKGFDIHPDLKVRGFPIIANWVSAS